VELEQSKGDFARRGINVAAVTHDNVAILGHFAGRKSITYPMLADDGAAFARAFGIVNESVPKDNPNYGMAFPGTYILDENGVVVEKFFEDLNRERVTASSILVKHFRETAGALKTVVETEHLTLTYSASDAVARAGKRIALSLEVGLKPRMHVYAPGVEGGYKPIEWTMTDTDAATALPPEYPRSETLHLPAINETVPVYHGRLSVIRDLSIGSGKALEPFVERGELKITGALRYQACDDKMCFPPETIPLEWSFRAEEHDRQTAPKELRAR
jgi:hypothetical protein